MSVKHFLFLSKLLLMVKCQFASPSTQKWLLKQVGWGQNGAPIWGALFSLNTNTKSALVFDTLDKSPPNLHWGLPKNMLYQNLTLFCRSRVHSLRSRRANKPSAEKFLCFPTKTSNSSLGRPDIQTKPWQRDAPEPSLSESDTFLPIPRSQLAQ